MTWSRIYLYTVDSLYRSYSIIGSLADESYKRRYKKWKKQARPYNGQKINAHPETAIVSDSIMIMMFHHTGGWPPMMVWSGRVFCSVILTTCILICFYLQCTAVGVSSKLDFPKNSSNLLELRIFILVCSLFVQQLFILIMYTID